MAAWAPAAAGAPPRFVPAALGRGRGPQGHALAHVVAAGVQEYGVVDYAVHDRVGVDAAAEALVPVLALVLGGEQRRALAVAIVSRMLV